MSKRDYLSSQLLDKKLFSSEYPDDSDDGQNGQKLRKMALRALKDVISEELSEKQKKYVIMYYYEQKTLLQISNECGVNISTVSRTVARGRKRIIDKLKYYYWIR